MPFLNNLFLGSFTSTPDKKEKTIKPTTVEVNSPGIGKHTTQRSDETIVENTENNFTSRGDLIGEQIK